MKQTLGIDLGTNSLGWAILDDITLDVLDKGVIVFPEGMNPTDDNAKTPAAQRRAARAARRIKFRRQIRKRALLKELIKNGMCPLKEEELELWKKNGIYPVGNKDFIEWLKSTDKTNPYKDRANAAEFKVEPYVLGRALYHICQRRGFKSSRKDAEKENDSKETGKVTTSISEITKAIEDAGCKTLGQYFALLIESEKDKICKTRIRNRYTGRIEHYEKEFKVIMEAQGYAPESDFYNRAHKAIFDQRPLRSQKHLVGSCPLEPGYPRAQIGHPLFEEFRARAFVNNLTFENEFGEIIVLTPEERELAYSAFLKESPRFKFKSISSLFKKKFKNDGLKFHYYKDDESLSSSYTTAKIKAAFGEILYDEQKVFDALMFFDDNDKLKEWFKKHYPSLNEECLEIIVGAHLAEGNAKYSLKAIKKILPFLRKGYNLYLAKFLAKMPELIPDFAAHEEEIVLHLEELEQKRKRDKEAFDQRKIKASERPATLIEMYRDYFLNNWGIVDEKAWNSLYLKDDEVYQINSKMPARLGEVKLGMIRNPIAQRSLTTLRYLVNYLRDHDKIDQDTAIRIELARTVNDYASRNAIIKWQKMKEDAREDARKRLLEEKGLNITPNEDAIDKYLLWQEQKEMCLYTGKHIDIADLFNGNKFDIEHSVPRSKSGDNSMANKTICEAKYNRDTKKGRLPTECPNYEEICVNLKPWKDKLQELEKEYNSKKNKVKGIQDPLARTKARVYVLLKKMELDYWRDKVRRFEITADKLEDPVDGISGFKRHQLVDTGVMCSHAVEFLHSVYPKVYAVNGAATSFARKAWGVQVDEAKDRTEHTHHAKDAMVIAALTPKRFNAICTALKDDGGPLKYMRECDICPPPCEKFAEKVRRAAEEILVKHIFKKNALSQSSKKIVLAKALRSKDNPKKIIKKVKSCGDTVRGSLHKDTFYGCIIDPDSKSKRFVVRKSLEGPVPAADALADDIVDPEIREIVKKSIADLIASGKKNIEKGDIKMPSGVPINKVRIFANSVKNPAKLKNHPILSDKEYKNPYYVTSDSGSNFRLGVFNIGGKLSASPDNLLDWAQNHKSKDYLSLDKRDGFVGYIYPGSMALVAENRDVEALKKLTQKELVKRLYRVVKFEDRSLTFRYHLEARPSTILAKDLATKGKHAKGESSLDIDNPHELLRLSASTYFKNMLFEGIDFKILIDGTIVFLK